MINYRIIAIIKREIKAQIFTKRFIFMTLSLPVIMGIIIGVIALISNYQEEEKSVLTIITQTEGFQTQLQSDFLESPLNDQNLFELSYMIASRPEMENFINENRQSLLNNEITGVVFVPDAAREDKRIEYYSSNPGNQTLLASLRAAINRSVIDQYFSERDIDQASIDYARKNVQVDANRVTEEGTTEQSPVDFIIATALTFLLYVSLLIAGPMVMGVVSEEKTNRVVEVLLSSVSSNELMAGKIIGTALAFLAQMLIWLSPIILLSLDSLPMLSTLGDFEIDINLIFIVYYLFNYFLGLLIYLSIFSVFGAIFDNPQEAQSSMFPVVMLIMIPFFLAMTMAENPANFLAEAGSMAPFFSIIIMPARMTLIDVPLWQTGLAIMVNLATLYFVIKLTGKIYRIAILVTGKRPGIKELYKWIRYS